MDLKGKTVFVTGSSSGIGRAIAVACAQKGAKIIVHYRKNKNGAEETLAEVKESSDGFIVQADLSRQQNVTTMFLEIKKKTKTIDVLVNNAGESIPGKLEDMKLWESQFADNFMSMVYVSHEFVRMPGNFRKIVNISSVYGLLDMTNPQFMHYCAAKAAVNSLTVSLAKTLAPKILVNAVAPGYTQTPPWEGCDETELNICKNLTRIKQFVQPDEIAQEVISIIENDAIVGEIIRVDGGLHLWDIH